MAKQIEERTWAWSDVINQSEEQIREVEVQRRLRKLLNWKAPVGKKTRFTNYQITSFTSQ